MFCVSRADDDGLHTMPCSEAAEMFSSVPVRLEMSQPQRTPGLLDDFLAR